jgi:hypothetical protein
MMSDLEHKYPSNSFTSRKPQTPAKPKNIERVTTSEPIVQKRGLGKRFAEVFIGADAKSVWQYIAYDVLVPAAKDMVSDAVSSGIERMLFGEGARSRGYNSGKGGFTSYNKMSGPNKPSMSNRGRARHDFKEIVLPTRPEAEDVLNSMYTILQEYGVVSVNDFYQIVGITGSFADAKYGWTDMRGSRVERVRNGYLIDLPAPEVLE